MKKLLLGLLVALCLSLPANATQVVVEHDGTAALVATTSNCKVGSGGSLTYGLTNPPSPSINQFTYYAASNTGNVNWMAW